MLLGPAERPGQGLHAARIETYPEGADHTRIRGGGTLLMPQNPRAEHRDFTFDMQGLQVLKLASRVVPGFLERLRPGLSTGLPGIDRVIPHQASQAGLDLLRRYGWPAERVEVTLPTLGNVIAASVPLTLHQALRAGRLGVGETALLVGTGAGLIAGGDFGSVGGGLTRLAPPPAPYPRGAGGVFRCARQTLTDELGRPSFVLCRTPLPGSAHRRTPARFAHDGFVWTRAVRGQGNLMRPRRFYF
ncbi:3-oxoacyl-[acyl-carrier-protein] synthase III C-terminal domain-containing protein [Deinococcus multiflagellatus]|uniref:3-oxoacyl-[acyl-carrier-protein] synthase III C-terminal domain-containing protein n=1 Tax=Deinococcus multiflagellatus TaxID=1656887 RepID=A0ABW1ZJ03_9DEIO